LTLTVWHFARRPPALLLVLPTPPVYRLEGWVYPHGAAGHRIRVLLMCMPARAIQTHFKKPRFFTLFKPRKPEKWKV